MNFSQGISNKQASLCIQCATFYGAEAFGYLCSVCYKKYMQQCAEEVKGDIGTDSSSPQKEDEEEEEVKVEEPVKKEQSDKKKCFVCNKKVGLLGMECRCGYTFCTMHRLPQDHKCDFDHLSYSKQKALKEQQQKEEQKRLKIMENYLQCDRCKQSVLKTAMKSHRNSHIDFIIERLYLGNKHGSQNKRQLLDHCRVTHVVNAAKELPNHFQAEGVKYINLDLRDNLEEQVIGEAERAAYFINQALRSGGVVFVHCAKGRSRSVSVIIMYLMLFLRMSYEQSLTLIQSSRAIAKPNLSYRWQLQLYYNNHIKPK